SEVNGRIHLELSDAGERSSADGTSIHLKIMHRPSRQTHWKVVWQVSVLARAQEWVQIPVENMGDDLISVWSYRLPDGAVLVESDIQLSNPLQLHFVEPHVFTNPSQPARLWSAQRADGDYQLIETVGQVSSEPG